MITITFGVEFWYLIISVAVALWVGWTLHRNGRVFLVEVFQGKEDLADSINHLILVGFYLVSIGFVAVAIRIGTGAELRDMGELLRVVSTKVGLVLLVLGATHFLNLLMFSRMRWRMRLVSPPDPDQHRQVWEHEEYLTSARETDRPDA